ncbi:MAG: response regulator [Lachnospiraceae bacterium]|nr:response regulator [Lachnospiraceae bacterium]
MDMEFGAKNILFIEGTPGFLGQAIANNLEAEHFSALRLPEDIDAISFHRFDGDILLYYPTAVSAKTELILRYLTEISKDDGKILLLIGSEEIIKDIKGLDKDHRVQKYYVRPINTAKIAEDIRLFFGKHAEYQRRKTLLVIDDDPDFLSIMGKWLQEEYKVDGVRSGAEALFYLQKIKPDLILLDYEMPEMDGYEIMDHIRKQPDTYHIPIIFLTGKNDKESVLKILSKKPDGYLLKSMKKEELLDSLKRFFTESILNKPLSKYHGFSK